MNNLQIINFELLNMDKDKEFLCLTIQSKLPYYNMQYNPYVNDINKEVPFIYRKTDEIENNNDVISYPFDSKIFKFDIVSNNIFCSTLELFEPKTRYRIYSDLTNHKELSDKIYSLDYKLIVNYSVIDKYFFITLKYNPNLRTLKILKIKEKIKENNDI